MLCQFKENVLQYMSTTGAGWQSRSWPGAKVFALSSNALIF
jgi:hypothetical protein